MNRYLKFIIALIVPIGIGIGSRFLTMDAVNGWFLTLNKPSFNPPNSIFAPVWTVLYLLMGLAFFFVWKSYEPAELKRQAFIFYFLQLGLNFMWSLIFFAAQLPGFAFIEIVLLWLMILGTLISFANVSRFAGWLMAPYFCWVSFAAVLNFFIWRMN